MKKTIIHLYSKFISKVRLNFYRALFPKKYTTQVFTNIYKTNYWNSAESHSGTGSELIQTEKLIFELSDLFKTYNIKSVLDIPCGDFKWMQKVDFDNIDYVGGDIVKDLIETNSRLYSRNDNYNFIVIDLISDPLPASDLIIVRDCLVHFSNFNIVKAMKNIKASGSKYLLTTTFPEHNLNQDISTGDWRPINLNKHPFNFAQPIVVINENCTEEGGIYNDKSLALWEIDKL